MKKAIIVLLILLLFASAQMPASAVSDYDLYKMYMDGKISKYVKNGDQYGGKIDYLFDKYTAHGTLGELIAKMEWLHQNELKLK